VFSGPFKLIFFEWLLTKAKTTGIPVQDFKFVFSFANIYLHYSFGLWLNKHRKYAQGNVTIIRYADDAVLGFQKYQDAIDCQQALNQRLLNFGLEIHPKKTKLIRFGSCALAQCQEKTSRGKLGTFDFLGFTHYIGKKLSREVVVKRKIKRKRQIAQLKRIMLSFENDFMINHGRRAAG